jgi:hypothetical protein
VRHPPPQSPPPLPPHVVVRRQGIRPVRAVFSGNGAKGV